MRVLGFVVVIAVCYVQSADLPEDGEEEELLCVQDGQAYPVGTNWTTDGCEQFACSDDAKLSEMRCPLYKLRAGCSMDEGDLTKSYPDCCRRPHCPGTDGTTTVAVDTV